VPVRLRLRLPFAAVGEPPPAGGRAAPTTFISKVTHGWGVHWGPGPRRPSGCLPLKLKASTKFNFKFSFRLPARALSDSCLVQPGQPQAVPASSDSDSEPGGPRAEARTGRAAAAAATAAAAAARRRGGPGT
jgi:hypothetical protein